MDIGKQNDLLNKMKADIENIQKKDYDNPLIKLRLDRLEEMYSKLRNKVQVQVTDTEENVANRFVEDKLKANNINEEDIN